MDVKKILSSALIFSAVIVLSSCENEENNNESNDTVTEQSIPSCVNVFTNRFDGSQTVKFDVGYQIYFNYTRFTAKINIQNFITPDATTYPKITLDKVTWKGSEDGWKRAYAERVSPTAIGISNIPTFSDFHFNLFDRIADDGSYLPILYSTYNVGDYSVLSFNNPLSGIGETVSKSSQGTQFRTEEPIYFVYIKEGGVADLGILNAQFSSGMPPMTMNFPDIPYNISGKTITLQSSNLTPVIGQTPFPGFPITNLKATLDLEKGFDVNFVCTVHGDPYTVTVNAPIKAE